MNYLSLFKVKLHENLCYFGGNGQKVCLQVGGVKGRGKTGFDCFSLLILKANIVKSFFFLMPSYAYFLLLLPPLSTLGLRESALLFSFAHGPNLVRQIS